MKPGLNSLFRLVSKPPAMLDIRLYLALPNVGITLPRLACVCAVSTELAATYVVETESTIRRRTDAVLRNDAATDDARSSDAASQWVTSLGSYWVVV